MRRLIPLLALAVLPFVALAQDIAPKVSLKLEKANAKPGEEVKGTVTATFAPGLHGYQNPPTKDYMLAVKVSAGEATSLKSVNYPKGHMEMAGGEEAAVYSDTVNFPVVVIAPSTPGSAKVELAFFYQQCDAQACYMPATIKVNASLTVEGDTGPVIDVSTTRKAPREATFQAVPYTNKIKPGSSYTQVIRANSGRGLFFFAKEGSESAISIKGDGVETYTPPTGTSRTLGTEKGRAVSSPEDLAIVLRAPDQPGTHEYTLNISYMQADAEGTFTRQSKTLRFSIDVTDNEEENPVTEPGTRTTPPVDGGTTEPPKRATTASNDDGLLGFLNKALEEGNWALIIPAALLVGLALCLTPCVFPMIPVTVTFFSNQGSKSTSGRFSLGLFYALGIAFTYGAVGGISAAAGGAVGELFTKQWFLFALAALMVALALSMFDVYEIRLPGFIQKNLKGRSGPVGALIMGLLMGFAAAPCAGALVGAVAVKVAEIGSIPTGLGMFGLIGIGMGLPFMALATASSGAKALPKSGGWLKTTKAVLGLVVLYIAVDYLFKGLGLSPSEARTQIAWIAVFAAFAIYLLFIDKSDATRAVATIKGVTAVGLGVLGGLAFASYQQIKFDEEYAKLLASQGPAAGDSQVVGKTINWIPYNDENFAKAVASGKPIMIDGRADWCTICHEMEARVFHTPEGLVSLSGIYLLEMDWSTNVPNEYIEMTKKRFGIKGLPHVVFMEPGGKNEFSVGNIRDVEELKGYLRKVGAKL